MSRVTIYRRGHCQQQSYVTVVQVGKKALCRSCYRQCSFMWCPSARLLKLLLKRLLTVLYVNNTIRATGSPFLSNFLIKIGSWSMYFWLKSYNINIMMILYIRTYKDCIFFFVVIFNNLSSNVVFFNKNYTFKT